MECGQTAERYFREQSEIWSDSAKEKPLPRAGRGSRILFGTFYRCGGVEVVLDPVVPEGAAEVPLESVGVVPGEVVVVPVDVPLLVGAVVIVPVGVPLGLVVVVVLGTVVVVGEVVVVPVPVVVVVVPVPVVVEVVPVVPTVPLLVVLLGEVVVVVPGVVVVVGKLVVEEPTAPGVVLIVEDPVELVPLCVLPPGSGLVGAATGLFMVPGTVFVPAAG